MAKGIYATHWIDWRELRANSPWHRRQMDRVLQTRPSLLYFGDSWFSTPLYPNLARQSIDAIDGIAMIAGTPGATSGDLIDRTGKIKKLRDRIERYQFDTLLLSLGGNDAIDKLPKLFSNHPEQLTADEALHKVIDSRVFTHVFNRYDRLLKRLNASRKLPAHFKVIAHNYAPLVRIGVAADLKPSNIGLIGMVIESIGPWIWGPMQNVLADKDAAREFARKLLDDGFMGNVLKPLADKYPSLLEIVDFSSLLDLRQTDLWFDEIHPNRQGFAIMANFLNQRIRRHLPRAKKQAIKSG